MSHHHHHLIPNVLHLLGGGALGATSAALAQYFGTRSADRLPGESRYPQCLYCLRPYTWQELFPLIGWLLRPDTLALSCPCGLRKGQWAQPSAELIGLFLGLLATYAASWSPTMIPLCLGIGLLPAIAIIDLEFGIIPDGLNILLGIFGLWWVGASKGNYPLALIIGGSMLAVGLFCALIYSRWRKQEMLGLGDVKFLAAAGLWLQFSTAPWFLALAGLIGVIFGLVQKKLGGDKQFPFAPSLCLALVICVLYQVFTLPS